MKDRCMQVTREKKGSLNARAEVGADFTWRNRSDENVREIVEDIQQKAVGLMALRYELSRLDQIINNPIGTK